MGSGMGEGEEREGEEGEKGGREGEEGEKEGGRREGEEQLLAKGSFIRSVWVHDLDHTHSWTIFQWSGLSMVS